MGAAVEVVQHAGERALEREGRVASARARDQPFDLLAKDMLELLLEDCGTVERQVEVALPAQFVDVTFTPTSAGRALLRGRGLFGRMTSRRSAYECVHNPPSVAQLRELARKHLAWHLELTLRARRLRPRARVPLPGRTS